MKISDDELIIALLAGGSVRRAAKVLCISPQAIQKRLTGDLKKRYEEERLRLFGNISDELNAASELAVSTLSETISNTELPASIRVQAADSILRHTLRYYEAASFEKRLRALEEGRQLERL